MLIGHCDCTLLLWYIISSLPSLVLETLLLITLYCGHNNNYAFPLYLDSCVFLPCSLISCSRHSRLCLLSSVLFIVSPRSFVLSAIARLPFCCCFKHRCSTFDQHLNRIWLVLAQKLKIKKIASCLMFVYSVLIRLYCCPVCLCICWNVRVFLEISSVLYCK